MEKLNITSFGITNFNEICDNLYLHKELDINTPIFRYMKISHTIELLHSKKLYISNRSFMSDKREIGKKKDLHNSFDIFTCPNDDEEHRKIDLENKQKLKNECYRVCISCWTKREDESILFWRCYGKDTCRISTTIHDLIQSVHSIGCPILIAPVKYGDERTDNPYDRLFKKLKAYEDEEEIRVCVLCEDHHVLLDVDPKILINGIMLNPFYCNAYTNLLVKSISSEYLFLQNKITQSELMEYE